MLVSIDKGEKVKIKSIDFVGTRKYDKTLQSNERYKQKKLLVF
jgi:hypothetical protein